MGLRTIGRWIKSTQFDGNFVWLFCFHWAYLPDTYVPVQTGSFGCNVNRHRYCISLFLFHLWQSNLQTFACLRDKWYESCAENKVHSEYVWVRLSTRWHMKIRANVKHLLLSHSFCLDCQQHTDDSCNELIVCFFPRSGLMYHWFILYASST